MSRANEYMMPFYETIVPMQDKVLTRSDYKKLEAVVDSMIAAQRQRWEAETTQILDRLTIQATETKDVKTGAIRQTVGLGYILNERRNLAALDGERGKEQ